jgi:hypothetical protein
MVNFQLYKMIVDAICKLLHSLRWVSMFDLFQVIVRILCRIKKFKIELSKVEAYIIFTLNLIGFHCECSLYIQNKSFIYLLNITLMYSINILEGHDIQMQKWIYIDDCTMNSLSKKKILVNWGPLQWWTSSLSTPFVSSCRGGFPCLICSK